MLPPNPTELLMSPKVPALFKELKKSYDYVIIDTPPAGLVTDAEIIAPLADTTFYVVRQKHTYKQQLLIIEKFARKGVLPRLNIILNDVAPPKKTYGRPYDYGYGYGYGPVSPPKKRNWIIISTEKLSELFKRIQVKKNKPVT
jgi:Mrp family chromosome partitioning ATPase